jgi:cytochrome P450
MADGSVRVAESAALAEARAKAWATPLEDLHPGDPELFRTNTHWPYFERLRAEAPVHWCKDSEFGPYWSVTRYNDIMAVDTNHGVFSSDAALGGITIRDARPDLRRPSFIAMDPPKHDAQRKTVSPIVSPHNLATMEPIIRERAAKILDALPVGETFDWVAAYPSS